MAKKYRVEIDTLGTKKVDNEKLWGAQTQRALENFKIGNEKMPKEIIIALGYQKKAATLANIKIGKLNTRLTVDPSCVLAPRYDPELVFV